MLLGENSALGEGPIAPGLPQQTRHPNSIVYSPGVCYRGGVEFVGREIQLDWLNDRLREVKRTGQGQMLSVRGRRQVGKSRLIEEFISRSGEKSVYYTATRQPAAKELDLFRATIAASPTKPQRWPRLGHLALGTQP